MAGKRDGAMNGRKLNAMQVAFCEAFCDPTVRTYTEAATRAGYQDPGNQGSRLFATPKVQAEIHRRITALHLTPTAADIKLAQQLEATEPKVLGSIIKEVIAWDIRDRALDKLLKLQGRYKVADRDAERAGAAAPAPVVIIIRTEQGEAKVRTLGGGNGHRVPTHP